MKHSEQLKSKPWNVQSGRYLSSTPPTSMLNDEEVLMLRWLGKNYYSRRGCIVDGGAFLGGSAVAFAEGLREAGVVNTKAIYSYDLFIADSYSAENYALGRFRAGDRFRGLYDEAISSYKDLIKVYEGDICCFPWTGEPIEILFLDCCKTEEISDFLLTYFFPYLIPGHSLVIQQDYLWPACWPWIHVSMECLSRL